MTVKAKDLAPHAAKKAAKKARKTQLDDLKTKKFSDLNNAKKDQLLKQIALRLEMIQDD